MECEVWLVGLLAAAFQRVSIGLRRAPQVGGVEVAVAIEHFRKAQRDRCARRAAPLEAVPAREVLAEIKNGFARRRAPDCYRSQLRDSPHGRGFGSQESGARG